jgi:uncharacterized membrane protein YjjP (DUF1212 family)
MNKILFTISILFLFGCSKTEPVKMVEKTNQSEELLKRIKDTNEVCDSLKKQLSELKTKVDKNTRPNTTLPWEWDEYRRLPETFRKNSIEYLKVCGVIKQ